MIKRDTRSLVFDWIRSYIQATCCFFSILILWVIGFLGLIFNIIPSLLLICTFSFMTIMLGLLGLLFLITARSRRVWSAIEARRMHPENATEIVLPLTDVPELQVPITIRNRVAWKFIFILYVIMCIPVVMISLCLAPTYTIGFCLFFAAVLLIPSLFFDTSVTITDQALIVRHGWRSKRIPWRQATLFAVIPPRGEIPYPTYELSSASTILRWLAPPSSRRLDTIITLQDKQKRSFSYEEFLFMIHVYAQLSLLDLQTSPISST